MKETVRGTFNCEGEKRIITICVIEDKDNQFEIGNKIVLMSENDELEGIIDTIENVDMGLLEGKIIKYKIEITSGKCLFKENAYYDFQLYSTKKKPILYYLYQKS